MSQNLTPNYMDALKSIRRRSSFDLVVDKLVRVRSFRSFSALVLIMILSLIFLDSKLNLNFELRRISRRLHNPPSLTIPNLSNSSSSSFNSTRLDYARRFSRFLKCNLDYNRWTSTSEQLKTLDLIDYNYSRPAPEELQWKRVLRAVAIHFSIRQIDHYMLEFRWLYRSWSHMQRYEPTLWRTDLLVFVERHNSPEYLHYEQFLNRFGCRFDNIRRARTDPPMCTLVAYEPFKARKFPTHDEYITNDQKYKQLFEEVNVFAPNSSREFDRLYKMMKTEIEGYNYIDSILIAFEG